MTYNINKEPKVVRIKLDGFKDKYTSDYITPNIINPWGRGSAELTPEQVEQVRKKLNKIINEKFQKGSNDYWSWSDRDKWTIEQWFADYEEGEFERALDGYDEWLDYREKFKILRKHSKEIRSIVAARLSKLPNGEGITTEDLILESPKLLKIIFKKAKFPDLKYFRLLDFIKKQIRHVTDEALTKYATRTEDDNNNNSDYAVLAFIQNIPLEMDEEQQDGSIKIVKKWAWVHCTEEQIEKVKELVYKRRIGMVKGYGRFCRQVNMPMEQVEEGLRRIAELEQPSKWRDALLKAIEEELKKNPHNLKQFEERLEQEAEKWK